MSEKCVACGGHGYWCRGCGGYAKRVGMKKEGLTDEEIERIYTQQFAGCDKPTVPCVVCNMEDIYEVSDLPKFWS